MQRLHTVELDQRSIESNVRENSGALVLFMVYFVGELYDVAETPEGVHLCCRRPSPHVVDLFRSDQYPHEYALPVQYELGLTTSPGPHTPP